MIKISAATKQIPLLQFSFYNVSTDYVKCVQEYVGLIIALSCLPTADVQPDGRLPPIDDMEKTPPLRQ